MIFGKYSDIVFKICTALLLWSLHPWDNTCPSVLSLDTVRHVQKQVGHGEWCWW